MLDAKKVRLALAFVGNAQKIYSFGEDRVVDLSIHTPVLSFGIVGLHIGLVSISNRVLSRRYKTPERRNNQHI